MEYPLQMRFKLFALASQITVTDAKGTAILYIKQKMFKFKEHVEVFRDASQQEKLFDIRADRIIDFSASYSFTAADGSLWGSVRRRGGRSLWQAFYEVIENGQIDMQITEETPWKKLVEGLCSDILVVGWIVAYLLNPSYLVKRPSGEMLMRVVKKPAVFEGSFEVQKLADVPPDDELRMLMSLIMMVLLERKRG